jgi:hypothetical protein
MVHEVEYVSPACMDNPAEAAQLPGWGDAAVQAGTNPYFQPLKMLVDDMNNVIQSRISIWEKVSRWVSQAWLWSYGTNWDHWRGK